MILNKTRKTILFSMVCLQTIQKPLMGKFSCLKQPIYKHLFSLSEKVARLVKANINIKREMPISKSSRVFSGNKLKRTIINMCMFHVSGPEVKGTRPVLVTFESFKDRDEVLRKVTTITEKKTLLIHLSFRPVC